MDRRLGRVAGMLILCTLFTSLVSGAVPNGNDTEAMMQRAFNYAAISTASGADTLLFQEASLQFRKAADAAPERADAQLMAAWGFDLRGDATQAAVYYRRAAALEPAFALMLGDFYLRHDAVTEAFETFEQLLHADAAFAAAAHTGLGRVHTRRGEWADAKWHLERALEEEPGRADASIVLSAVHLALGEPEAALQVLEAIADRSTWFLPFRLQRARVYEALGERRAACHDLNVVLRYDVAATDALALHEQLACAPFDD